MSELNAPELDWEALRRRLRRSEAVCASGRVTGMVGLVIESEGPPACMGDICHIECGGADGAVRAEVVGFREHRLMMMPLGDIGAIAAGSRVVNTGRSLSVEVSRSLLGRVIDPLGNPLDGRGRTGAGEPYPLHRQPPNAMERQRIEKPLALGIRAVDGLLTVGQGQRIGIFAGSGVGKSTLLGSVARSSEADVNVVGLIGERGREVREFVERDLGPEGLSRSVVVVATSDQPAVLRLKGAMTATAIAEYFRDQGLNVMLMMDSVTRFAWAQREIGLAVGEPPTTRGYTPSVIAMLPRLMERAGNAAKGSITALYTVLVDGDDMNEPVADAARSILDGHIVLRRELAARGHYPAIDVLESVSRLMSEVASAEHREWAQTVRGLMATFRGAEDLIQLGAYTQGSSADIDRAIAKHQAILSFLRQPADEPTPWPETLRMLAVLAQ